jgi:hypothetical protein
MGEVISIEVRDAARAAYLMSELISRGRPAFLSATTFADAASARSIQRCTSSSTSVNTGRKGGKAAAHKR